MYEETGLTFWEYIGIAKNISWLLWLLLIGTYLFIGYILYSKTRIRYGAYRNELGVFWTNLKFKYKAIILTIYFLSLFSLPFAAYEQGKSSYIEELEEKSMFCDSYNPTKDCESIYTKLRKLGVDPSQPTGFEF
ncbi:hypothetical protein [uncultured Pseudoteredinibacter sp.]|uniref:hypothetical protein n=1 Tax=uncultured Pseudoteredinibacter sp. TaxID=1641701 RepID=UPI00262B7A66|nr:hypothetical protein [uncultured Pseudoteredinibacter sp.]